MRRAAAAALAAAAQAQPRALQPHWLALLPRAPPVAARAHVAPTLADLLLFDPQAQVPLFPPPRLGVLLRRRAVRQLLLIYC